MYKYRNERTRIRGGSDGSYNDGKIVWVQVTQVQYSSLSTCVCVCACTCTCTRCNRSMRSETGGIFLERCFGVELV